MREETSITSLHAVFLSLLFCGFGPTPPAPSIAGGGLPKAFIAVGDSTQLIRGIDDSGILSSIVGGGTVTEPREVTLRYLDGVSGTLASRAIDITTINGCVIDVALYPMMQPAPFKEVKAHILRTLASLHIKPDRRFMQSFAKWPDDMSLGSSIKAPNHGVVVAITIGNNSAGYYYTISLHTVEPDLICTCFPATEPTSDAGGDPEDISLGMGEKVSDIHNPIWHVPERGLGEVDLLQPQKLTLHTPDGHSLLFAARSVHIFCYDGVVRGVFVRRPMRPIVFKEAKADMLKTLADLKIQPDRAMKNIMSFWPPDAPDAGDLRTDYGTGMNDPADGLDLDVDVCPDPGGGWYYLIVFNAYGLSRDLGLVPTTRPTVSSPASATALP
jgi:hypothetical protein